MNMRYPKSLPAGGTIGFVAPAFGCATEPYRTGFNAARLHLEQMGYRTQVGPNCYEAKGIGISNTPEACGEELTRFYCSSENQALISCGGGELMCTTLDFVDFDRIRAAEPKWYMGYSDNTNFTFLLATLCDVASIYGPCAAEFGMTPWDPAIRDAFDLLTGAKKYFSGYEKWEKESLKSEENPLAPYHLTEAKQLRLFSQSGNSADKVSMEGRLIGGCLDCLSMLAGTCYDHVVDFAERYQNDGLIWYLESCDLNVMSIRRVMWQLSHAGWFEHVKGFVIGRPLCFGQELMGMDSYEAVMGVVREYRVPVIMDADFGHLPPKMPMINGGFARITADEVNWEVTYL